MTLPEGVHLTGGKQYPGKYSVVQTSLDTTGSMLKHCEDILRPLYLRVALHKSKSRLLLLVKVLSSDNAK